MAHPTISPHTPQPGIQRRGSELKFIVACACESFKAEPSDSYPVAARAFLAHVKASKA